MQYRVEVSPRATLKDGRGEALLEQIAALGIEGARSVAVSDLFFLEGAMDHDQARTVAQTLLGDPVVEEVAVMPVAEAQVGGADGAWTVEVALRPGVTDSVAETIMQGAQVLGFEQLKRAATGSSYRVEGDLTEAQVRAIAQGLLANEVIQQFALNTPAVPPFTAESAPGHRVERVALSEANDGELLAIGKERRL
ncbi:MAG: phosphoribosylformylglycinamidine synthase subunit PurS, partial [Myxococcota bacterium]